MRVLIRKVSALVYVAALNPTQGEPALSFCQKFAALTTPCGAHPEKFFFIPAAKFP